MLPPPFQRQRSSKNSRRLAFMLLRTLAPLAVVGCGKGTADQRDLPLGKSHGFIRHSLAYAPATFSRNVKSTAPKPISPSLTGC
jgi:hypothetical protein